ncbi:B12-binding domain-containing radical SAM protein [Engelhardtia mirabilis]|uniref:Radical SAM superfamily protein n=1 Tax=Engelhardtia mirabilis TaxID=2528011 RepID=A0A518BPL4_9BACT|nr:Radical SAM superfamily protein [Planctomycetes bacterium Pla133]QDV03251.1 Radical SAM superfamily protein [Planctomycetes bacterium Pla86]
MRVLFVYPNLYTQMGFNHGLASLSASLKAAGHETRLVNLNENLPPVPSDDELWDLVCDWQPGLIGFSCLTQQYAEGLRLARLLRERAAAQSVLLPPLVVGGIHPSMVPAEVMADGVWDHVGVGECEDSLVELARRVEAGESPDDVRNFLSWKGGVRPTGGAPEPEAWVHNPVGEFPDLETLPMPDYGLFDTARITAQKHGWFGLMTSRGCPYRCTYCLNHKIIDRYRAELGRPVPRLNFFRFRPPGLMVEEIRWVLEQYPDVGTFILDDDLFTQNPDHAIAFCEAYVAAGFDVPFVVNSHVKQLDPRVAQALAKAGCRILKLGIEAGAVRVRKEVLKRNMSDADILETIKSAEGFGLHTSGFVMTGLPGETREERWATVELLAASGIGRFRTSLFFPFPGTESYRLSLEGGYIDADKVASLTDFTSSSALDFGADENLFIDKLATCMPWFVNSRMAGNPAAARYAPLVERVLALDARQWEAFKPSVREVDSEHSKAATAAQELHYAIRYNAFMGVRSDFFLAEEHGIEWLTAAAKPVPERLRELALAAAANEVC